MRKPCNIKDFKLLLQTYAAQKTPKATREIYVFNRGLCISRESPKLNSIRPVAGQESSAICDRKTASKGLENR